MSDSNQKTRCGVYAIVGLPNAGKSTFLNAILDFKIAPVHSKPQMTKKNILGIYSENDFQLVFIDTPGVSQRKDHVVLRMREELNQALEAADGFLFLLGLDQKIPNHLLQLMEEISSKKTSFFVANKVDLPAKKHEWHPSDLPKWILENFFAISSKTKVGVNDLVHALQKSAPEHEFLYPKDDLTTANYREIAANIVLEKLMDVLGQELPYQCGVVIESFQESDSEMVIEVVLIANRQSQKGMIVGKGGQTLKRIGKAARQELQKLTEKKVKLYTFVKVDPNWIKNSQKIKEYL